MLCRVAGLILVCIGLQAQTSAPLFDVASIKPAIPLGPYGMAVDRRGGPGTPDPGTYACRNCPLRWVLDEAYDLKIYQYAGPEWLNSARFDFAARIPEGTTKPAFRIMLQNLL